MRMPPSEIKMRYILTECEKRTATFMQEGSCWLIKAAFRCGEEATRCGVLSGLNAFPLLAVFSHGNENRQRCQPGYNRTMKMRSSLECILARRHRPVGATSR